MKTKAHKKLIEQIQNKYAQTPNQKEKKQSQTEPMDPTTTNMTRPNDNQEPRQAKTEIHAFKNLTAQKKHAM